MHKRLKSKKEIVDVNGRLKNIVTYHDEKGNVLQRVISPLKVEFKPKDMLQVVVGASILAIPVGFTEETWRLGEHLPFANIIALLAMSLLFISAFVYYNYHSENVSVSWEHFIARVIATYIFSFAVVALLLGIIQVTPWATDWALALKRVIIVTFPSTMSAAVADTIK
jgi:uncharacterized membrane protein